MVLITACPEATVAKQSLMLNSGRELVFFAPSIVLAEKDRHLAKNLSPFLSESKEKWDGVVELCQTLDTALEENRETELFDGRTVLELGFSTGLPSVFALANGATHVTIHCQDKDVLDYQVKPTLRQTRVKRHRIKLSSGDWAACKRAIGGRQFDVILAAELLHDADEDKDYENLHEILDLALASSGIVLLSTKPCYASSPGNLHKFLETIKKHGQFDVITRWTTSAQVHPRKIIQLTRAIR